MLGLLAALKLGTQEYMFRASTTDLIIGVYRDHAVQACQREASGVMSPQAWTRPTEIKLVIGKSDLGVYLWQTSHALWNARYRNPYLFVTAGERPGVVICEYDVVRNSAALHRL